MRRFPVTVATAVVVALVLMGGWASAAQAESAVFRATPLAGPPGTPVSVSSVTPCQLPAGVTGAPLVRVTLMRGNAVVSRASFPVSSSGGWQGVLTVGSQAALGGDLIVAFCFASPQAEGVLLAYQAVPFTVTAAGAPTAVPAGSGGQAATSSPRALQWTLVGVGVVLLALGGVGVAVLRRHPR